MVHASLVSAVLLTFVAVTSLAAQPVRQLKKPDAEFLEPFTSLSGVRELSDGRVIAVDRRDRSILLLDFAKGTTVKVGRQGSGPAEYGFPGTVLAMPRDTTFVFDLLNQRYLVIDPSGRPVATWRAEEKGGIVSLALPIGSDDRGRIYSQGSGVGAGPDGTPIALDSAAIVRYDRSTTRSDTVAYLGLPSAVPSASERTGTVRLSSASRNPFAARDSWMMLPDGRVAVARVTDYHLDLYGPGATRRAGPKVPYEPIHVTERDKADFEASQKRSPPTTMRFGGATGASPGGGTPVPVAIPLVTDWPEFKPPFLAGALWSAAGGEIWVGRSRIAGDDVQAFDVFNGAGELTAKVVLPARTSLIGFGARTAYVIRTDSDDFQHLQRYRLR